ncbi:MAG: RluA family pseudouridine synthase [Saprospiraceae bacterium]|nr:RluA family pseudouridine synthase [Saprospiraceae bacterium]
MTIQKNCFLRFQQDISKIELPQKFTFPFYFEPHELTKIAANELQQYLENQSDWSHNFGLNSDQEGLVIGKMFGVLVVQNEENELGYLAAFSGKLADKNHHSFFVPPVFDMLDENGFYKKGEAILNQYNREIAQLEQETAYLNCVEKLNTIKQNSEQAIQEQKFINKAAKINRGAQREEAQLTMSPSEYESFLQKLGNESLKEGILLKQMTQHFQHLLLAAELELKKYTDKINGLKEIRKQKSALLQQQLFEQYAFLNQYGQKKSIGAIFDGNPPAGAGECAGPKMLQYAFMHQLKPIAFAEFWWGQSPKSEIRKHRQFYPACKGKCEPILNFMLEGIPMDDNPFKINPAAGKDIDLIFEDDYLAVVNKPAEFLSVPGKEINDSVFARVKKWYPNATGPLIVHRLDMSTSGLLLIAKTTEIYVALQAQFIKRTIKKRYVALLDGNIEGNEGVIDLPLRLDIDNRPHQVVCYEHGKAAQTIWKVIARKNNQTLVHFFPITGRTHQLRVHAAHPLGLNTPIVGDDLYGSKTNRLCLHAAEITFFHPIKKENVTIELASDFED